MTRCGYALSVNDVTGWWWWWYGGVPSHGRFAKDSYMGRALWEKCNVFCCHEAWMDAALVGLLTDLLMPTLRTLLKSCPLCIELVLMYWSRTCIQFNSIQFNSNLFILTATSRDKSLYFAYYSIAWIFLSRRILVIILKKHLHSMHGRQVSLLLRHGHIYSVVRHVYHTE